MEIGVQDVGPFPILLNSLSNITYTIFFFWMSHYEHATMPRGRGVSPFVTDLGLYWDSPLRLGLKSAV